MGAVKYARFSLAWLICLCAPLCQAALPEHEGAVHPTREQLIGAWRLVKIDYSGPSGPIVDPFYQADSTGIIVYDSSGWMSVHIVAPHREASEIPASRVSSVSTAQDARLKAAAFDTYYAYFGTWDLDQARSTVTHHVQSSLIPAETGLSYTQTVTLENGRLVFTGYGEDKGEKTVRRKVWERITGGAK
jgi:hypothetical protein